MSFGFDHVMDILRLYVYVLKHTCHVFFTTLLCDRAAPAWRAVVFFPQELQVRATVLSAFCLSRLWRDEKLLWGCWCIITTFKAFYFKSLLFPHCCYSVTCQLCVILLIDISTALPLTWRGARCSIDVLLPSGSVDLMSHTQHRGF